MTWAPAGPNSAPDSGRRCRALGFFRIFAPGQPRWVGKDRPPYKAAAKSKIRTIFCRPGLLALVAAAILLPASIPNDAEGTETTNLQERSALAGQSVAIPHAGTTSGLFSRGEWDLDEAEWQRYQTLMRGIRGSVSPATLSPIEVLGIHARDEAERRKYAQRFARIMREDTERILAFQRAYDQAAAELDPPRPARAATAAGDRLLLFVAAAECAGECKHRLASALAEQRAGARLDIYVLGAKDDEAIRSWAKAQGIDAAAVREKRITLNHERGELGRVAGPLATAPVLVRLRDGVAVILTPGA